MQPVAEHDLERRVKLNLAATRPELARLSARVHGSTVKLSGHVGSFYLRQLALAATQRVAGVRNVTDAIEVPLMQSAR